MMPVAGNSTSFGIVTTMSGLPIVHPSLNTTGAGLSFAFPSAAPFSAHAAIVAISSRLSTFAFSKCPIDGSANHGGIVLLGDGLRDGARIRARVLERQERHRRDRAGAMTLLAIFLKDRENVSIEGRVRGHGRGNARQSSAASLPPES